MGYGGTHSRVYNAFMTASGHVRTPVGICAMCFGRRPLTHGWAWLKLCADCALIQRAPLQPQPDPQAHGDGVAGPEPASHSAADDSGIDPTGSPRPRGDS
jgi:hypothetical protein